MNVNADRWHKTDFSNAASCRPANVVVWTSSDPFDLTWKSRSCCAITGSIVHHSSAEFPTFPSLYPDPVPDFRTSRTIRVETVSYGRRRCSPGLRKQNRNVVMKKTSEPSASDRKRIRPDSRKTDEIILFFSASVSYTRYSTRIDAIRAVSGTDN